MPVSRHACAHHIQMWGVEYGALYRLAVPMAVVSCVPSLLPAQAVGMAEYIPQLSILLAMDWLIGLGQSFPVSPALSLHITAAQHARSCVFQEDAEWDSRGLQACSGR